MPSVLVLVLGNDSSLSNVADAVVAGAKSVRFTEVTVRANEPDVFRYRAIDADEHLASFDGVVIVAADGAGAPNLLTSGDQPSLVNTVVGKVGGGSALSLALVDAGAIIVSIPVGSPSERAQAVGARVAKVAGWVRHALGHEAEAAHHHSHQSSTHGHHH